MIAMNSKNKTKDYMISGGFWFINEKVIHIGARLA